MVFVNEAIGWKYALRVMRDFLTVQPFAPPRGGTLCQAGGGEEVRVGDFGVCCWPQYDSKLLIENIIEIPVQVNGKLRDVIKVARMPPRRRLKPPLASEKVSLFGGKTVKKVIYVPKRLVNIAVS